MTQDSSAAAAPAGRSRRSLPRINTIGRGDLKYALVKGVQDFRRKPSHAIFLTVIYPIVAFILINAASGGDALPTVWPLIAGFSLVGPFAALGLYEMSRRRENGEQPKFTHGLSVVNNVAFGAIATLGVILMALFFAWLGAAQLIYAITLGTLENQPDSLGALITASLTTPEGWGLLVLGNGVGFLFALAVFAISATSFPMLLDRDGDALTAAITSVRAVAQNFAVMAQWGVVIAVGLAIGFALFGFGLAVVFPILGHATWHLYRKLIAPEN